MIPYCTPCAYQQQLPGQQLNVEALLTIPPGYLHDAEIKEVGIILAHGNDADDWRSRLLSEVALELGKAGAWRQQVPWARWFCKVWKC